MASPTLDKQLGGRAGLVAHSGRRDELVAGAGLLGKIFLELAFHAFKILGVRRRVLFLGDVGPALGVLGIHLEPFLQARLGVRLDGVGRAFGLAHAAIDAFV